MATLGGRVPMTIIATIIIPMMKSRPRPEAGAANRRLSGGGLSGAVLQPLLR